MRAEADSSPRFLLAQLHMDSLEIQTTLKGVRRALKTLPQELSDTYHEALQRIRGQNSTDRELAERILSWISYALKPLTWKELQCALAVEKDESELDEENLPDKALLTSLCAGLVMIDPNSNVIRLVHYTAQEYFARIRTDQFPDAPVKITITCLTYLLFDLFARGHCLDDNELTNRLQDHPFLRYAARNWGHHAYGDPETQISDLIIKFLDPTTHVTSAVQVMLVTDYSFEGYSQKFPRQAPALWICAYFGLEKIARTLLAMGADPAAVTSNGETALHQAAANGHTRMVQLLKEAGADLEMEDHVGGRAIHRAAANGQDEVLLWLMKEGAAFNAKDRDGVLPLHLAASKGHVGSVTMMLDRGASAEVRDNSSWTPLHWASRNGHSSIVDLLLKRDVNNDARTDAEETPLHWAARNGHSEVARLLLDNGANPEPKDQYGWTALYRAAESGHLEVARLLIERGAYVDAKDEYDWVRPEITEGNNKLVDLLREQRTDVEVKYDADWSALSLAVEGGTHTVVGMLSELGANTSKSRMLVERWRDVEADNSSGWTALHRAARNGHVAVTRLLLEHGANVNARDSNGWSPLHGVARNGNYLVLPILLEFGADIEAKDSLGRTALDGATQMGHDVLVRMLLDQTPGRDLRGADVE